MLKGLLRPEPAPEDRSPERPRTRRALFRRTFGDHWNRMFAVNLVCFAFYLPAFIWTAMSVNSLLSFESSAAFQSGSFMGAYLAGLLPCIAVTGPMLAGATLLMRNWSRGEPCMRWHTFFGGMKRNLLPSLGFSLVEALMPLAVYSALSYYGGLGDRAGVGFYALFGFCAVAALVALLMRQTVYTLTVTYALRFGQIVRNAFLIAFLELPKGLLTLLVNLLPLAAFALLFWLLPARTGTLTLLALAYYALFGIAFERFVSAAFANYAVEKHLNVRLPGARVDIGMASERATGSQES